MKTVNVIEAVFFAALEKQNAGERAAYLDQACTGDPDLRRCVEKLLAAQPRVGAFLEVPAPGLPAVDAKATVDHHTDERPGTVLGPYKLLHEIGEGGMGTVWMAEQAEPVKRRVALKVIKPGMDSRQILARFEAERQALALMDHPNIARVLDAGATEAGRPYFVMELVKGQPITEFCDKNRLTTHERLDLFMAVCNAIQHAHQKGVIHRDIKPSNVLVALYDGKPVPKVIDFGVAKAMVEPLTTKTLFTRHGQVVGTFEYMSPEQATLDQVDIDTRSDVYALGVLMYELLTGTTPLDKERLREGGLAEVLRLIREEEPLKPSTRLTSTPGLLATAAAYRNSDSQKLSKLVRGELDWIVMKALDKDRNRRFPSASELAMDVGRYLRDEPVQACPPTLAYRFQKWTRKNKVAFATTSAVAAALVIGLALTSWQAVRATNAEQATAEARRKTEEALDDALRIGRELDASLSETKAANARIQANQNQQRADQYAWDMRGLRLVWESGNAVETKRLLERQPERLRGFEWRYWDNVTHSELLSAKLPLPIEGAPQNARSRDWIFSGDGSRVALLQRPTGFGDEPKEKEKEIIVTVWELGTRKEVRTHRFAATSGATGFGPGGRGPGVVRLSHDGKRVLVTQPILSFGGPDTGPERGTRVEVFDVERDKVLFNRRFEKEPPFYMMNGGVNLSLDGRKLVAGLQTFEREQGGGIRGKLVSSEIKVFDLDAGDKELLTIPDVMLRSLSADGTRIVTTRGLPNEDPLTFPAPPRSLEHKVWDADIGKELSRFEAPGSRRFSPDGKEMFDVVLADGQKSDRLLLKSYSAETGKERLSIPLPFPAGTINQRNDETGTFENVFSPMSVELVISRDGSQLMVGRGSSGFGFGSDSIEVGAFIEVGAGKIRAAVDSRFETGQNRGGLPDAGVRTTRPFFTADGKQFILTDDNVIRTFDSTTGKLALTLRGHDNAIVACAEGADGRLWSVEADGTLKQWSLQRPEPLRLAAEPIGTVARVAPFDVSADGAWVAGVHVKRGEKPDQYKSIVEVWDTAGKEKAKVFEKIGGLRGSRFGFGTQPISAALSADGRRVAMIRPPAYPPRPAEGEKIDAARANTPIAPADLTVWDAASGEEIYQTELRDPAGTDQGFRFSARPMIFSPDGEIVGAVRHQGTVLRLFDIKNRREKPAINFGAAAMQSVRFSPDGRRVAAALQVAGTTNPPVEPRGKVVLCDVATGTQQEIAARVSLTGSKLAFSPDGTHLLMTYQTPGAYEINLYDTATGKHTGSLYTPDRSRAGGFVSELETEPVFSPDGRRVAGLIYSRQSAAIKVWDAESGKDLLSLPAPWAPTSPGNLRNRIYLAFTPDNNRLVMVTTNGRPRFGFASDAQAVPLITVTTYDATPRPEPKQP